MILLGSDTETKPSLAMREAMAKAIVGDEQKGTDPTVNTLLENVARLLGKEKALFLPSGTMCNFVAIKAHTRPTETIIAEDMSHIIRAESAGIAMSSGVLIEHISTKNGQFTREQLLATINKIKTVPHPYSPKPSLVCLEQTHNLRGGTVWSLEQLKSISETAKENNLKIHVDGARLLNACVATHSKASEFGKHVDSLWIDFTKGLGAPLGAVLAGSAEFIEDCRLLKHSFGGALRQAGIVAAGCQYALDHHIIRLEEDHINAQILATELERMEGIEVLNPKPETNMVFFKATTMDVRELQTRIKEESIEIGLVGEYLRAVTHLDITTSDIEKTLEVIKKLKL